MVGQHSRIQSVIVQRRERLSFTLGGKGGFHHGRYTGRRIVHDRDSRIVLVLEDAAVERTFIFIVNRESRDCS